MSTITYGERSHFWRNVLWSDKIELFSHNGHRYVRRKKGVACKPKKNHPIREARGWQPHVVGVLCCRRDWCTSQNFHKMYCGKLVKGYPKRLTQVSTILRQCKLLINWDCDERIESWNKSFSLLLFWHFTFLKSSCDPNWPKTGNFF